MAETKVAAMELPQQSTEIKVLNIINKVGIWALIIVMLIVGFCVAPTKYFSIENMTSTIQAVAYLGMVTAGMAFVTYSANYADMSAPLQIALSGMVCVQTLWMGFWPAILCGILTGVVLGFVNGFMIGKLRANPIIWTMAWDFVLSGFARWAWGGKQIYPDMIATNNPGALNMFNNMCRGPGTFIPVIVFIVLFIIAHFLMTGTKFGSQLKVTGSNYETARLSGINVVSVMIKLFIFNGICCALAGIFLASVAKTGIYDAGDGYDFRSVTSVLLGGMMLTGGRGNIIGVFGGVLAIGILTNILNLLGVPTFSQYMVQGVVFLIIVWLNTNSAAKLGRG
jgi:ribose/xylose/arabinose/galactoside ABC-type transport system permease subunit